jgi:hypothetical protein
MSGPGDRADLAERLDMPLRERNAVLLAAGFAPVHAERSLKHPAMGAAHAAIDMILRGHEPFPAFFPADAETGRLLRQQDGPSGAASPGAMPPAP